MAGSIFQAPPHFQIAFDNYWRENMAQQRNHRLAGTYFEQPVVGEAYRGDIIGAQSYAMRQVTARAQKTEPSDVPNAFWWVRPRPYDKTTWADQFDKVNLGALGDPSSAIMKQHGVAASRQKDLILYAALGGTRYVGAQGTTPAALPSGQQIAVTYGSGGANSGLQLAKLTQASYILDSNDVETSGRYFGYSAKELNNLLTNVDQVNNTLYTDVQALREGRINAFMGFEFKMTQLTPFQAASTTIRLCYAWQKDFLALGMGEDVQSRIDLLPMQSYATQIYTCLLMDASRVQDEGVVQVACDESI